VRRGLLILGVLAACLTAGAAGASSSSTITARSTVSALAADGAETSFATGPTLSDCDRVFVWQSVTRHVVQLGKKQRCKSKTQFLGLAVTKGRALWLTASAGSVSTLKLWTATTKRPTPRLIDTATRDTASTDPQPILVGSAGGGLLPYAEDTAVTVLNPDGKVALNWTAPAHVVALAARGGQVAVAQDGNRVTVLDSKGNILSVDLFTTPVTAVAMTGKGLLVQRGTTLELRRGADAHQSTTSPTGTLADADSRWAAWTDGKYVHVIRLPDGTAVGTYPGTAAALAGSTLYIANGKTITIRTLR
jgi:DNA-binding beta-propeller fold protein YncE